MKKKTIYITFFIKKSLAIDNKLAFLYFCSAENTFMAYF